MAYLDNSGDIILDAVLTDTGRKLMAEGRLQISKYAFGDDEINYALYNPDHPSGSSYADLEILQTPVFEAFTVGPPLKYGLISNRNLNLYYLPDMLFNDGKWGTVTVTKKNNVVYVAVNSQTATSLKNDTDWNSDDYNLLSGRRAGGKMITIESCIDNADVLMTSANLENYIASTHLLDLNATVTYDNNFISSIMSAPAGVNYSTDSTGEIDGSPPTLVTRTSVIPGDRPGFRTTKIDMSKAGAFIASGAGARDVATLVQSLGVVGSMTSLNVTVPPELQTTKDGPSDSRWTKFGQTGVQPTGFGGSDTFSIIDTSIEITGTRSGASLNIPLTLIRRDDTT